MRKIVYVGGFFSFVLINSVLSLHLLIGNCPIYFDEPCNTNNVKFILSMRRGNHTILQSLNPYEPKLPYGYNVVIPLKIVVHGYGGLSIDSSTRNVSTTYQDLGYNLIIVDWERLAALPCYPTAYLNTWYIGQCLAALTMNLMPLGVHPGFVHVIGFSLGAHVAGFAGSNLKNMLGYSYRRITGLDPALPLFATLKNEWKLDSTDAAFVDIIHTSAGVFGKLEATGHVDFYINGGSMQPFCYDRRSPPLCSHLLSGVYFAESIRNKGNLFIGMECDNLAHYYFGFCDDGRLAEMGEYTSLQTRGTYFVKTAAKPPFALGLI